MPGDLLPIKHIRIPERRVEGRRLGRHVRHDPRSLSYLFPERDPATLTSVRHERAIPVLDQGNLGSCTGNAAEGCVGSQPYYGVIPGTVPARPTGSPVADEDQAVALYSAATRLDDYDGSWPPDDSGSDGLSVAKAAQRAGLISGYQHCTSLNAALAAIAERPVIAGINWYDSFDEPSTGGLIEITPGAQVRGGHEIVIDEINVTAQIVGFTNSWGPSWGHEGRGYLVWEDFERLLKEDGDVTVFVPISEPAPTPTPPAPTDLLSELAALLKQWMSDVGAWLKKHGLG